MRGPSRANTPQIERTHKKNLGDVAKHTHTQHLRSTKLKTPNTKISAPQNVHIGTRGHDLQTGRRRSTTETKWKVNTSRTHRSMATSRPRRHAHPPPPPKSVQSTALWLGPSAGPLVWRYGAVWHRGDRPYVARRVLALRRTPSPAAPERGPLQTGGHSAPPIPH